MVTVPSVSLDQTKGWIVFADLKRFLMRGNVVDLGQPDISDVVAITLRAGADPA